MAPTISALIASTESGDRSAADALFASLYAELHQLAQRQLARRGSDLTLGVTTLLHEAYLDIAQREGWRFPTRRASSPTRRGSCAALIIDCVRATAGQKRGGEFEITRSTARSATPLRPSDGERVDELGEALDELAAARARARRRSST